MESSKYLEDIASIKTMMSKSSRFMSLSGLSGILAGLYALVGAFIAYRLLAFNSVPAYILEKSRDKAIVNLQYGLENPLNIFSYGYSSTIAGQLIITGLIVLIMALVTGGLLTLKKARKNNEAIWDSSSKRLIANFAIPLFSGGAFCIALIQYGIVGLIAPATLIFYGLGLINASKYTLGDIKYLGLANVIIGLLATQFIGYGLYFWALGFGIFHIIYGTIMYRKYDKES
ncbi:hypothetical protein [Dokdonia donghaensis]|uniref:Membrane protein n=1 Tax=Dokdonia donghaensis DSW-1 TaxID=1300343 RepID=A0A0A2GTH4_9FLAO|nr:hypothetical protein [Dokdonia donghaensis]ANH59117.1 hypothetical protein I597_0183 [Dokdonia donghaensis DSW-1]KGO06542.1 membrane protein [Dokdonia donghaensis DSW-1]